MTLEKAQALADELGLDFIKNDDGYFVDHRFAYSLPQETVEDLERYLLNIKSNRCL